MSVKSSRKGRKKNGKSIGLKRKENKKKSKLRYLKEGTESNGEEKIPQVQCRRSVNKNSSRKSEVYGWEIRGFLRPYSLLEATVS